MVATMTAALTHPQADPEPDGRADGGPTPERLLDAAEQLFAARGIDAVSVRAVNAAAGANVAAVHYHFGSKEALVEAVLRRRMDALAERRRAMLATLPVARPAARAVVEALVVPLAELAGDPDGRGRAYVRVLATLQAGDAGARGLLASAFAPQFEPFDAALARALPDLPEAVRHFRLGLVGGLVVQTLADPDAAAAVLGLPPGDHDAVVTALVDTITGALAAPVSPAERGTHR